MAARQLPARRYFAAFLLIVAGLYSLVFLTGDQRTPQLGLDLQGGTTVTLEARTPDGQAPDPEDLDLAREIIEQRVNGLGVAEAEVVTEGNSNIVISVPGEDGDEARELGATAQLRFRPVLVGPEPAATDPAATDPAATDPAATDPAATDPAATDPAATDPAATDPAATDPAATEPAAADPDAPVVTQEEALAEYATLTCDTTTTEVDQPESFIAACSDDGTAKFLLGPAVIEGTDVADATAGTEVGTGEWVVNLDFTSSGSAAWADYTTANVGNNVAITLDGRVVSAPTINSAIVGGTTQITGSFDQAAATELANQLKYGALPLTFSQATAQTITTELGSEQLRAGLIAGGIGVALVFVYALLYYRLLGLVMIASLVLSAVVVYACLVLLSREIGFALSLAGIAGFIVSIGITADSFVVYFERLKDEVREGRSLRSATPRAWVRARRTILSADAVSFLAAAILYWLAIGDVKGFAFTLGLSTVLDLIVVFLFTHPLMVVLSRVKGFGTNRFSGLGRVDHSRRPVQPSLSDRELVGAATGSSSTNGSNR
ncbi:MULTISPECIES: protein translocase subunit SecD [unclassified Modestobacter]|uniref:protein translocase subunit SecD n=1 Tax=unclassified Modestobacter TaxID=2643866 RepID=UPI0022AA95AC|nr:MULTISPECIES: protein translocase subunit SecD [unclassified Modestobacter]MCZ2824916.1 protein translocase subunit SecD [Modestobacter sp. VKM Ac-2981]MCZ2854581.1 protein translocase subunit SecD [Modestobacter sp. VKM Ac-2982]